MKDFMTLWEEYTKAEREDIFPGSKELGRLANGIMETDALDEANPYHDPKTGRFPKGGAKKGTVYSLTKRAQASQNIDDKFIKKGIVSGGRDKDGTIKTHGKYGMPDKCGRRKHDGTDIPARLMCSQYKQPYRESLDTVLGLLEDSSRVDAEYLAGTIRHEVGKAFRQFAKDASQRKATRCDIQAVLRLIDAWERSKKGELKPKKQT